MRLFNMLRDFDITGNSGTGKVAEAVEFDDGTTIVKWSSTSNALGVSSLVVYSSLEDAITVHGHNGSTRFEEVPHWEASCETG